MLGLLFPLLPRAEGPSLPLSAPDCGLWPSSYFRVAQLAGGLLQSHLQTYLQDFSIIVPTSHSQERLLTGSGVDGLNLPYAHKLGCRSQHWVWLACPSCGYPGFKCPGAGPVSLKLTSADIKLAAPLVLAHGLRWTLSSSDEPVFGEKKMPPLRLPLTNLNPFLSFSARDAGGPPEKGASCISEVSGSSSFHSTVHNDTQV